MANNKDRAMIGVSKETRALLGKYGRKDQTYDDIINELLDVYKNNIPADRRFLIK
jgi:hypothetical protein